MESAMFEHLLFRGRFSPLGTVPLRLLAAHLGIGHIEIEPLFVVQPSKRSVEGLSIGLGRRTRAIAFSGAA
jgi:hypothetical protein